MEMLTERGREMGVLGSRDFDLLHTGRPQWSPGLAGICGPALLLGALGLGRALLVSSGWRPPEAVTYPVMHGITSEELSGPKCP